MAQPIKIIPAATDVQFNEIRTLFREYATQLSVDLDFQGFPEELATLPGHYAPPLGALFLAMDGESVAGCVAMKSLGHGVCEMKRLYVRPKFRKKGIGRMLAGEVVRHALQLGYHRIRLDTLASLIEAMDLYRSMGFKEIPPYYDNPLSGVVYWELRLR